MTWAGSGYLTTVKQNVVRYTTLQQADLRSISLDEPHSHNPASGLQSYAPVNTRAAFSPSYMACVPMGQPSPGMHHRIVRPIPLQLSDRERWYSGTNSLLQKQIEADPPQEQGTDPLTLKHLSLPTTAMEPDLRTAIQDLMRFCTHAQQVPRTQQVEEHITDKLIYPIARLPASKGSGSRNGHEAYQCLWPRCHKITLRKGNAVSHLLSHVQYKPFVCQEW
jgi:hypothetical protein